MISTTVEAVANAFRAVVKASLTPSEIAEVDRRNAAEADADVCHLHAFCDANMLMEDALETCGVRGSAEDEAFCELWGAAWACARLRPFAD